MARRKSWACVVLGWVLANAGCDSSSSEPANANTEAGEAGTGSGGEPSGSESAGGAGATDEEVSAGAAGSDASGDDGAQGGQGNDGALGGAPGQGEGGCGANGCSGDDEDVCLGKGGDGDLDGVCQSFDNCTSAANGDQADGDGDGLGDACDAVFGTTACNGQGGDPDQDDVCQSWDNCPELGNPAQTDSDGDGSGDDCDATPGPCDDHGGDTDDDTWCDAFDNCPEESNLNQLDRDNDNVGDVCDAMVPIDPSAPCNGIGGDDDGDDYCGFYDNCPELGNPSQSDLDEDGMGDVCDSETCDGIDNDGDTNVDEGFADSDGDGVEDCVDLCAQAPDVDEDNDHFIDCKDECPGDSVNDPDNDNACNGVDNCPNKANYNQKDEDGDGIGDACDVETCDGLDNNGNYDVDENMPDSDGDGLCDAFDVCPVDPVNDRDDDGVCGDVDNCNAFANPGQENADEDAWGDLCDIDAVGTCGDSAVLQSPGDEALAAGVPFKWVAASPTGSTLYATRSSSAASDANMLLAIDPSTKSVLWRLSVGSDPGQIAVAADGSRLYVALDGAAAVRVIDLPKRSACFQFPMGNATYYGPLYPGDIAVLPGSPETLVVSTRRKSVSPDFGGVFVYDNGAVRPVHTDDHTGARMIEVYSDSLVYGFNNSSTEFGFRELSITPAGISENWVQRDMFVAFYTDILHSGGRVYATSGAVLDPTVPLLLGTFAGTGPIAVDDGRQEAYIATSATNVGVYDTQTFAPLRSITLPALGTVSQVVRWGSTGLVARHATGLHFVSIL